jgi:hypothetical protein
MARRARTGVTPAEDPPSELITAGVVRRISPREAAASIRRASDELVAKASGVGHAAVLKARTQIGVRESPPGTNQGVPLERYVRWFAAASPPAPWCAYFVSWCHDQVTDRNRRVPWRSPGLVSAVRAWRPPVRVPVHGDFFGIGDQHMGIVWQVDATARTIKTVEGNYSDGVAAVERSWGGLWFVRP